MNGRLELTDKVTVRIIEPPVDELAKKADNPNDTKKTEGAEVQHDTER